MPRGGHRPNAGRKLSPETIAFRAFWRNWFESPEGRRHLIQRAKRSDAILAKLIDKVFPTPQAVDASAEDKRPIRITVGQPGNELNLQYGPVDVPALIKAAAERRSGGT